MDGAGLESSPNNRQTDVVVFYYGFRPARGRHQALDALTEGIHREWSISEIGRLYPTGINTPVKKVVGSVTQVGNQDDR